MSKPLRVLIVEDSPDDAELIVREIKRGGFDLVFERVETSQAMKKALNRKSWDIIIADYVLPRFSGLRALAMVKEREIDIPFILVSGEIGEETAIEVMKAGASDYIMKNKLTRIVPAILRELSEAAARRERRVAREELGRQKDRASSYLGIAGVIIIAINAEGIVTLINKKGCEILGYKESEIVGKNWFANFLPRRLRTDVRKVFNQLMDGKVKNVEQYENLVLRKDGTERVIAWHNALLREKGEIVGTLSSGKDVTEYKEYESRLQESEERSRNLIEMAPDAIITLDLKGNILTMNPSAVEISGYSADEIIGKRFTKIGFVKAKEMPKYLKLFGSLIKGAVSGPLEIKCKRKDGTIYWLEARAGLLEKSGKKTGVQIIARDITERKQVEQDVQMRARLLDAANDSIIVHDMEGNLIYVNEGACKAYGYNHDKLMAKNAFKLRTDEKEESINNKMKDLVKEGDVTFESSAIRKDGRVMPVEIFAQMIQLDGKQYVMNIARDITERRKAEQDIRQTLRSLKRTINGTVEAISLTVESRDPYTAGHQRRVTSIAGAIAKQMGFSKDERIGLETAAMVHDIGKIQIPAEILNKPGKLSEVEFSLIKNHPSVGYDILKSIDFPWPVARITLEHHERMNGSGYPQGLSGDKILFQARIVAVADVVEAMQSHRPYRPAFGVDKALAEIKNNKGILYDPEVADVCIKVFEKLGFKLSN